MSNLTSRRTWLLAAVCICLGAAHGLARAAFDAGRIGADFAGGTLQSVAGPDGFAYTLAPDGSLWIDAQKVPVPGPLRQVALIGRSVFAQTRADKAWWQLAGGQLVAVNPSAVLIPLLEGRDTLGDLVLLPPPPWKALGKDFETVPLAQDARCRYGAGDTYAELGTVKAGLVLVLPATFGIADPAPNVVKSFECRLP